ncbi:hypothetical protein SAICODRAFT_71572 [Saitoella complicata NRRL Y-17804]|uniref:uncharacterized protein n=1 Tax=Saitoella complicata (strain BCRC 22490 / CBS 7301 / JCM 7358 / NBRC 10748 / NRRL Y-17804) TaxID=698492 RepID=UPI0008680C64|nr:uncharacterized protein SAICODRAFT_71572 [Saitoella complicata NRRL Y-17804]ODQ52743.1 hypothetical protein SAICODRAFT_71572 [Saitoella complicata NRRL Y-17804]
MNWTGGRKASAAAGFTSRTGIERRNQKDHFARSRLKKVYAGASTARSTSSFGGGERSARRNITFDVVQGKQETASASAYTEPQSTTVAVQKKKGSNKTPGHNKQHTLPENSLRTPQSLERPNDRPALSSTKPPAPGTNIASKRLALLGKSDWLGLNAQSLLEATLLKKPKPQEVEQDVPRHESAFNRTSTKRTRPPSPPADSSLASSIPNTSDVRSHSEYGPSVSTSSDVHPRRRSNHAPSERSFTTRASGAARTVVGEHSPGSKAWGEFVDGQNNYAIKKQQQGMGSSEAPMMIEDDAEGGSDDAKSERFVEDAGKSKYFHAQEELTDEVVRSSDTEYESAVASPDEKASQMTRQQDSAWRGFVEQPYENQAGYVRKSVQSHVSESTKSSGGSAWDRFMNQIESASTSTFGGGFGLSSAGSDQIQEKHLDVVQQDADVRFSGTERQELRCLSPQNHHQSIVEAASSFMAPSHNVHSVDNPSSSSTNSTNTRPRRCTNPFAALADCDNPSSNPVQSAHSDGVGLSEDSLIFVGVATREPANTQVMFMGTHMRRPAPVKEESTSSDTAELVDLMGRRAPPHTPSSCPFFRTLRDDERFAFENELHYDHAGVGGDVLPPSSEMFEVLTDGGSDESGVFAPGHVEPPVELEYMFTDQAKNRSQSVMEHVGEEDDRFADAEGYDEPPQEPQTHIDEYDSSGNSNTASVHRSSDRIVELPSTPYHPPTSGRDVLYYSPYFPPAQLREPWAGATPGTPTEPKPPNRETNVVLSETLTPVSSPTGLIKGLSSGRDVSEDAVTADVSMRHEKTGRRRKSLFEKQADADKVVFDSHGSEEDVQLQPRKSQRKRKSTSTYLVAKEHIASKKERRESRTVPSTSRTSNGIGRSPPSNGSKTSAYSGKPVARVRTLSSTKVVYSRPERSEVTKENVGDETTLSSMSTDKVDALCEVDDIEDW